MRELSPDELVTMGKRFQVEVDDGEARELAGRVNEMLRPLDAVDDLPVRTRPEPEGERSWHEPTDDPLNAIATRCAVPPAADGILAGMTLGVKDIIAIAGLPMECASIPMRGYIPGFDAVIVDRLRHAGATIEAKTNLDEFAASGRGTTSASGAIKNPHDTTRTAGGSSGGTAAAVAAGLVDGGLGTDTGGSIRIPAGFCGVVGLKPTYGLVPLHGIVENTYTQDHVGPMTRTLDDAARMLEVMAGKDERDPASLQAAGRDAYAVGEYQSAVAAPPAPDELQLGVLAEGFSTGVSDDVVRATETAIDQLEDAGAQLEEVSVPEFEYGKAVKNILSFTELAAHWRAGGAAYRRGGQIDEGYQSALASRGAARSSELGAFYKQKLLAGAQIIDGHAGRPYTRAQLARETIREAFDAVLNGLDGLVLPTLPDIAPKIDEASEPGFDYARNTRFADITRLPALTMPNGTLEGLPVGFQVVGDAFSEARLLSVGKTIQMTALDDSEP